MLYEVITWLLPIFCGMFATTVLSSWKWSVFLRADGIDVPITTCPGSAKVAGMGDVTGVVPMPRITSYNVCYTKLLRVKK